jgi:hypothetical protein
LAVVSL